MPASSSDGSRLVYLQSGPNSHELRLRDMSSGTEKVLSTGRARPEDIAGRHEESPTLRAPPRVPSS